MIKDYSRSSWRFDPDIGYEEVTLFFDVDLKGKHTFVDYFEVPEEEFYDVDLLVTEDDDLYGIMIYYPHNLIPSGNRVLPDVELRIDDHLYPLYDVIEYLVKDLLEDDPDYVSQCKIDWERHGFSSYCSLLDSYESSDWIPEYIKNLLDS